MWRIGLVRFLACACLYVYASLCGHTLIDSETIFYNWSHCMIYLHTTLPFGGQIANNNQLSTVEFELILCVINKSRWQARKAYRIFAKVAALESRRKRNMHVIKRGNLRIIYSYIIISCTLANVIFAFIDFLFFFFITGLIWKCIHREGS